MNEQGSSRWISLIDALAVLAMLDEAKPLQRLMNLLQNGQITSVGDYEFRTYREGRHFQTQGTFEHIPAERWEALAKEIEKTEPESVWLGHLYEAHPEAPAGELDLNCNGFRLAQTTGEGIFAPSDDYSETWFSAWDVHVWELELKQVVWNSIPTPAPAPAGIDIANIGGRPPKANWERALIHLFGKIYRDGWKPENIQEVNRELQNWLVNEGVEVSDTASRDRARTLFRALKDWDSAET